MTEQPPTDDRMGRAALPAERASANGNDIGTGEDGRNGGNGGNGGWPYHEDFPILKRAVGGHRLVYLDNAATTQKPRAVLDAVRAVYETAYGNVHRSVHTLGYEATEAFEAARARIARFVNAHSAREIVFVRGATEAINLVAATFGRAHLRAGDEIVLTALEHHSNLVPWQMLRDEKGVLLRIAPVADDGTLQLDEFAALLGERVRLVAVTHVSNVLGTLLPVAEIAALAHRAGAVVLVDGCQAVPHRAVDVRQIDADFYAFSGHKAYGPSGIGVLYGKEALLETLPPYQGGGEMIVDVDFERSTFRKPPHRFEAGTPAIAEAIGLGAALEYLSAIGMERVAAHEQALLARATQALARVPGLQILGEAGPRSAILPFVMEGVHPHDIATVLDRSGVAIRAGHHCAQPLMRRLGVPAAARASFGLYNSAADVDALVDALLEVRAVFG